MSDKPLVSIIVLVHDQAAWADLCIRAVEHHTKNSYELIIVDSASKELKTREVLAAASARGHRVVRLEQNRSFSNGVNVGVNVSNGRFIVLLNDDAIVTEGWDTAMLQDAAEKGVGLVGARSNYAAGAQGNPTFIGEPPWLVFVCVAMRRDVWDVVGPMDEETFDGFSSEDIDYSWRVKKAGYRLKVSSAFVMHAGSRTLAATQGAYKLEGGQVITVGADPQARQRNEQKYTARLGEKWGKEWVKEHSNLEARGVVVSYHAEEWTRVEFLKNMLGLRRSDGVGFQYLQIARTPIAYARNLAADWALNNGLDWLVQIDDDATFPPDVLRRLLSHGKDVVTALAYGRKPPHIPCVFEIGPDGLMGGAMEGIEHTGLRRVDCSGFHCSIVRTSVIKRLRDAGITHYYGGFDNKVGEDFAFSLNLKKAGIPLYCDTELISGHIGSSIVVDEAYRKAFLAQGGK